MLQESKLPVSIKTLVLSFFVWPLKTGFTVVNYYIMFIHLFKEATAKFPNVDSSNKTLRRKNQLKRQSWIDNVS